MKKLLLTMVLAIIGLITASAQTTSGQTVTFDFSTEAGITELGLKVPAKGKGTDIAKGATFTKDGVIFTNVQPGGTPTRVWNYKGNFEFRFYAGSIISLTAPTGKKISQVKFDATAMATDETLPAAVATVTVGKKTIKSITVTLVDATGPTPGTVAEPVFSPVDTDYDSSVTQNIGVKLSCATQGAKVYYTTDGNDPVVPGATEYTAPINVSTTTTIKAISVLYEKDGKTVLNRSAVVTKTYTFTDKSKVELPVIAVNPEAGPYTTAKLPEVTLTCPTKDAPIYYTLDGSEPAKTTAKLYTKPFKITESCTLKVIALSPNETPSAVVEQAFVINPQAPTITPNGGEFYEDEFPVSVEITCAKADAGAKILYSVDGSEPSIEYTTAIQVSAGQIVNAVAVFNGTDKSEKSTATFTSKPNITVATPTFTPNGGSYDNKVNVKIATETKEATIYYSLDGGATEYLLYPETGIDITESCSISAIAKVKHSKGEFVSTVSTSQPFTITKVSPKGSEDNPYTVEDVINNQVEGTSNVWIIGYIVGCAKNGSMKQAEFVNCTVNSNIIIASSKNERNSGKCIPVKLPNGKIRDDLNAVDGQGQNLGKQVKIYGKVGSYFNVVGITTIEKYILGSSVETPVFSLAAGTYTSVQNVTISSPANTTIEYWSDIAPDHITSTTNSVTVTVDKSCTIFAMTVKGQEKSSQVSAKYIIDIPVAAPVITPNGGYIANNEKVTITCETQDAVIYYTTDGTDPKEIEANKYPVGGFVLDKDCTVKAIAVIPGLAKSQITTSEPFKLYDPAVAVKPVITLSPESPNNTYRQGQLPITVTIGGDIPSKSRIYFSFDNFETSPRNYTAPFTIDESCTIIAKTISPDGSAETLSDPVTITVKPYEGIIYSLVTDAAQLEDGAKYIVVSKKGAQHYAMSSITKQNEREASPIPAPDVNNEIILSQMESLSAENVTLKANTKGSGWGFITKEGYYLCNADPNEDWLNVTVEETYLDVTFDGTDSKSVINVGNGRTLQFVSNEAGDSYFTCHSLPQTPVYLYRLDPMSVRHISEPVFEPDGGEFQNTVNVTMTSATSDASIFYSLDGGKTEYRLYPDGGVDLTTNCEITAFAETPDGTRSKKVTSKPFLIYNPEVAVTPVIKLSKVSTDKVYCAFNIKDFPMKATIEGVPSNAEVYYSIDNGQEILYKHTVEAKDTLTISGPCTIKAYSKAVSGTGVSATTELVIKLKLVAPEITTVAGIGNYNAEDDIVYSDDKPQFEITNKDLGNSDVKIYYSLDGTTPSILYNAPVELTKTCIVRAIAKKEGFPDSDFDEMRFTVKKVKPKVRGSYMIDEFYKAYEAGDLVPIPDNHTLQEKSKVKMLQELYVVYSYRDIRDKGRVNSYIYVCDDSYYNNYANQVTVADGGFDDVHAIETGLVMLIFKQGADLGEFHNGDVIKEGLNAYVAQYQGMPQITVANASDITVKRRSVRTIWPITRNISQLQAHKNFRRNMCYYVGINNCYDLKEVDMTPTMRLYDITDGTGNLKVHDKFYFIKNNPALSPNKIEEPLKLPRAMEGILTVYDLIADKREMHIIKFQDTPTGVEGVEGENTDITIIASEGAIDVTSPFDTDMMVFNAAGGVVINQQIPEGDTSLQMEPGFYIVKVGQKVQKIFVR